MRFLQPHLVALANGLPVTSRSITARPLQRCLHRTSVTCRPRQRTFFTTNDRLAKDNSQKNDSPDDGVVASDGPGAAKDRDSSKPELSRSNHPNQSSSSSGGGGKDRDNKDNNTSTNPNKKKGNKNPSTQSKPKLRDPLRRVASLAQRGTNRKPQQATQDGAAMPGKDYAQTICAICVAESFDMQEVLRCLHDKHYAIDPDGMGFDEDEVVHARISADAREGDFYIFASGTVVTWSLPADKGVYVARHVLHSAKEKAHDADIHTDKLTEKLEFETDPNTTQHSMRGDTVVLGTKLGDPAAPTSADTGRAKIAFSSGLARSTKVAVLETLLEEFLAATEKYPEQLSGELGTRWWAPGGVTMETVLQRTAQILQLRAQLNFFSELTDDLPDKFWDQRSELNLDTIYDKVGKALDVPSRIRVMNQRMDYVDKMLDTFRGLLQAKKDSWLEEVIVFLIGIEVLFQLINWWREYRNEIKAEGGDVSFLGLSLWILGWN